MTTAHANDNWPPPYWPAALRLDQAGAYCGLSVDTFKEVCPVKPIAFTLSTRGNRYLRASLDSWLASLDPNTQTVTVVQRRKIGEMVGGRG
jgi:hypothetical protein